METLDNSPPHPSPSLGRKYSSSQHREDLTVLTSEGDSGHIPPGRRELAAQSVTSDPVGQSRVSLPEGHNSRGLPPRDSEAMDHAVECVTSNNVLLLKSLLEKGVPVHQRLSSSGEHAGKTLLEVACDPATNFTTFETLLGLADPEQLRTSQELIQNLMVDSPERDQKLKALLDKGTDPNLILGGNSPSLVSYLLREKHDAAMILLDKGADPRATTIDGMDAAQAAASRGNVIMLQRIQFDLPGFDWARICRSGFSIINSNGSKRTTKLECNAVYLAAFKGYDDVIHFYSTIKLDMINYVNDSHRRPIHAAAESGSVSCIRVLHENRADLTAQDHKGFTALHIAVDYGHEAAVKALLKLDGERLSTICDDEGFTPFMRALWNGLPDVISTFTGDQCSFNSGPSLNTMLIGETIDRLIKLGNPTYCEALLQNISCTDFEACELPCGCNPVMIAVHEKKATMLQRLLEWGCSRFDGSCSTHFPNGYEALRTISQDPELNQVLPLLLSVYLEKGIHWAACSIFPIHAAATSGNCTAIQIIIQHIQTHEVMYRYVLVVSYQT